MVQEKTEIVEESQQVECNIAGALNSYLSEKLNLKEIKNSIKIIEKVEKETEDYISVKEKIKILKEELVEIEEMVDLRLEHNEDYQKLRILRLKHDENLAIAKEKLQIKLEELPPQHQQMCLDLPDVEGQTRIDINTQKHLFVNGKQEL